MNSTTKANSSFIIGNMLKCDVTMRRVPLVAVTVLVVGIGVAVTVALHTSGPSVSVAVATRAKPPSVNDIRATKAYLNARYMLEQASDAGLPGASHALSAFAAHMSRVCPNALRGAPGGSSVHHRGGGRVFRPAARELLVVEIETDLLTTLLRSQSAERDEFIKKVQSLAWSDHKVTKIIHALINTEAAWVKEAIPDTCHDIKTWTASGYRKLAARTQRIPYGIRPFPERVVKELVAMGYGKRFPERDILQLLKNYQHTGGRIASSSVEQLEIKMAAKEIELLQRATRRIDKAMSLAATYGARTWPGRVGGKSARRATCPPSHINRSSRSAAARARTDHGRPASRQSASKKRAGAARRATVLGRQSDPPITDRIQGCLRVSHGCPRILS